MRILAFLALFCTAAVAPAQQQWFVDPVNGDDLLNDGKTPAAPFLSLSHALLVPELASGDTIFLAGGVYDTVATGAGGGNHAETFPLPLKNGVSIVADSVFNPPVIDGLTTGGTTALAAQIGDNITTLTTVEGLHFVNFQSCLTSSGVQSINGLVVEDCTFDNFSVDGVSLNLAAGRADDLVQISGCRFTSVGGQTGVQLVVSSGTVLNGGAIEDCTFSGLVNAVLVRADIAGRVDRDFKVLRNSITGFQSVGIWISASGGNSQNSVTVRGNAVSGDNNNASGDIGLLVDAVNTAGSGSTVETNGWIAYNDLSLCNVNARLHSNRGTANAAILNEFAGNVFRNATAYGVQFVVDQAGDNPPTIDPDFGGHPQGSGFAGRNTFENGFPAFEVGLDPNGNMLFQVSMQFNFWLGNSTTEIFSQIEDNGQLLPVVAPILEDSLTGGLVASVIKPNVSRDLAIRLQTGSFVVNVDNTFVPDSEAAPGAFGQYRLFTVTGPGGTINIQPSDIVSVLDLGGVSSYGKYLQFTVPGLAPGNYTIQFTNSGFQSLSPIGFRVSSNDSSGGGGGGGGCVVATAANGDYDQPQVRVLRSFRDRYLLPYAAGRSFVRGYYQNGPVLAGFIAERPWARAATRAALTPPTAVAWSLLHWNTGQRFGAGVFLLGLCFALLRRRR